jgi:ATP-dependent protease ClpP protease subunit
MLKHLEKFKKFTQPFNKPNKLDDEDDDNSNPMSVNQHLPYFQSTQVNRCIKAFIDEGVREAKYYRNLIHTIDSLAENDILWLSINTYGGHLDGAIAIINAIQNTDASVHCHIDGMAASAGSLLALASPSVSVSPYATMMIHAATFGTFGKQSDVISHASFVDKQVKGLMNDVYKDFLTDKELAEVIMGKEMWFNSDEIVERLQRREQLVSARVKKEQADLKKAEKALIKQIEAMTPTEVEKALEQLDEAAEPKAVKSTKNKK